MTYRLRRDRSNYIEDDWSEPIGSASSTLYGHAHVPANMLMHTMQPKQQQRRRLYAHRPTQKAGTLSQPPQHRKYIDPWDLENFEYLQRTATLPSSASESMYQQAPSPAGESIASTAFYYVPAVADRRVSQQQPADLYADGIDYMPGYAGFDEELFYNAKYESIHDDPAYHSMYYYTDIDTASSSNERTSSCGSSSRSAVSTLQLHTPGFGVRASGRRSIVLPKPEPHIEFPPAPPPHEYYTTTAEVHAQRDESQEVDAAGDHADGELDHAPDTYDDRSSAYATISGEHRQLALDERATSDRADDDGHPVGQQAPNTPPPSLQHFPHEPDEAHLPYCSLSNCYACVPEHVPVYAISVQPTMERNAGMRTRRISINMGYGEYTDDLEASLYGGVNDDGDDEYGTMQMSGAPYDRPPNNFGLSKRGLLQIDYSFNWNNLYRVISNGH